MSDHLTIANPKIETPCIKICTLDASRNLCLGCGRSIDEIARWGTMSAPERARVMDELGARMSALQTALSAQSTSAKVTG